MSSKATLDTRLLGGLTISVVRCTGLKKVSLFGDQNPQVSITVNMDKKYTRTIEHGGSSVEFNEALFFNLDCQPRDQVVIKVKHNGMRDSTIGLFMLALGDLIKQQGKKLQIQLVDEDDFTKHTGMIEIVPEYHGTNEPPMPTSKSPVAAHGTIKAADLKGHSAPVAPLQAPGAPPVSQPVSPPPQEFIAPPAATIAPPQLLQPASPSPVSPVPILASAPSAPAMPPQPYHPEPSAEGQSEGQSALPIPSSPPAYSAEGMPPPVSPECGMPPVSPQQAPPPQEQHQPPQQPLMMPPSPQPQYNQQLPPLSPQFAQSPQQMQQPQMQSPMMQSPMMQPPMMQQSVMQQPTVLPPVAGSQPMMQPPVVGPPAMMGPAATIAPPVAQPSAYGSQGAPAAFQPQMQMQPAFSAPVVQQQQQYGAPPSPYQPQSQPQYGSYGSQQPVMHMQQPMMQPYGAPQQPQYGTPQQPQYGSQQQPQYGSQQPQYGSQQQQQFVTMQQPYGSMQPQSPPQPQFVGQYKPPQTIGMVGSPVAAQQASYSPQHQYGSYGSLQPPMPQPMQQPHYGGALVPVGTPAVGQARPHHARSFDDAAWLNPSRVPSAVLIEVRVWAGLQQFYGMQCVWLCAGARVEGPLLGNQCAPGGAIPALQSLALAQGEHIVSVGGRMGAHGLEALTLQTSAGQARRFGLSGQFLYTAGTEFQLPLPPQGQRVLGFHGSAIPQGIVTIGAWSLPR